MTEEASIKNSEDEIIDKLRNSLRRSQVMEFFKSQKSMAFMKTMQIEKISRDISREFSEKHSAHLSKIMLEVDMGMHNLPVTVRSGLTHDEAKDEFSFDILSYLYERAQTCGQYITGSLLKDIEYLLPEDIKEKFHNQLFIKTGRDLLDWARRSGIINEAGDIIEKEPPSHNSVRDWANQI